MRFENNLLNESKRINLLENENKTHFFTLDKLYFNFIKYGTKCMELRLNDEKRQKLQVGDIIIFSEKQNNENKIITRIINLFKYESFQDVLNNFEMKFLADKSISKEKLLSDLDKFYSEEAQKNYGVLAIEIKLLNKEEK